MGRVERVHRQPVSRRPGHGAISQDHAQGRRGEATAEGDDRRQDGWSQVADMTLLPGHQGQTRQEHVITVDRHRHIVDRHDDRGGTVSGSDGGGRQQHQRRGHSSSCTAPDITGLLHDRECISVTQCLCLFVVEWCH